MQDIHVAVQHFMPKARKCQKTLFNQGNTCGFLYECIIVK